MKLNLGCGKIILEGYVNIDARKTHENVVVANVEKLDYEPGSIDEILASDVYEHISYRKSEEVIKHWVDLLRHGGKLTIRTPNLTAIFRLWHQKHLDTKTTIAWLFGGQDYKENFHCTCNDIELITEYLMNAGIKRNNISQQVSNVNTNMTIIAIK